MVVGPGVKMRKSTLRNTTARVLVLGHRQVGKSAAIVRFTTGRFIQRYCNSTCDWLYRHPIGYDSQRNQYKLVELLEQKDIEFGQSELSERTQLELCPSAASSLSSRVALERQIDEEFYDKQQLLNKLHWANAYVVVYALNDASSFEKAIKYLNLIDNEVNSVASESTDLRRASSLRRPILLLANKRDLAQAATADGGRARQVSQTDGRLLAMRHHCSFDELSISETAGPIEGALKSLVERIRASQLHTQRITNLSSHLNHQQALTQTQLTYWIPLSPTETYQQIQQQHRLKNHTHEPQQQLHLQQQQQQQQQPQKNRQRQQQQQQQQHNQQLQAGANGQQPIWSSLVRTRAPPTYNATQQIVQSSCLAIKAKRLNEADFRLLTPVGLSLSSGSSSSASSNSMCATFTSASSALVLPPAQVARPLVAPKMEPPQPEAGRTSISSTSSMSSSGANSSSQSHFKSFKSSFRKASLAIVGSRSLAARVNQKQAASSGAQSSDGSQSQRRSLSSIQGVESRGASASRTSSDSEPSSAGTIGGRRTKTVVNRAADGSEKEEDEQYAKKPAGQRVNWIKSKISSLSKQENANSETGSIGQNSLNEKHEQQQQQSTSLFKRPLFKYKSRRKTVAFEPTIETSETSSLGSQPARKPTGSIVPIGIATRSSDAGVVSSAAYVGSGSDAEPSFQSKSLTDCRNHLYNVACNTRLGAGVRPNTSHAPSTRPVDDSIFIVAPDPTVNYASEQERASSDVFSSNSCSLTRAAIGLNPVARKGSHSTLSRASTSVGSFDEDDEDDDDDSEIELELEADHSDTTRATNEARTRLAIEPDYQLIRLNESSSARVQGSGNVAPAKKSFCSLLKSCSQATRRLAGPASECPVSLVAGKIEMAQLESVKTIPLIGFCK